MSVTLNSLTSLMTFLHRDWHVEPSVEPQPRSYGRHETRAYEKSRRRMRKASQRRNRL